jgi:hypothetical protein
MVRALTMRFRQDRVEHGEQSINDEARGERVSRVIRRAETP